MPDKVIITAALAGGVTRKENNPAVPYTPEEFAQEAKRSAEAGAAVVHIHFRDPDTGNPTTDPNIMAETMDAIRQSCDCLINLSTGVSLASTLEERKRPVSLQRPELASLNPGTMNFCAVNYKTGEVIADKTYFNPLEGTLEFARTMHANQIKPELECFAVSHVHNVLFLAEHHDYFITPLHFSFVYGVMGGVRFSPSILTAFLDAVPAGSSWQGVGVGPLCFPVAMAGAIHGGHIRVGLEDNIFIDYTKREKAKGNWDQVEKAAQIARMAGREVATVEEAKKLLHLPARD